jgi:hypothetical protein
MGIDRKELRKKSREFVKKEYRDSFYKSIECDGVGSDIVYGFEAGYECAMKEMKQTDKNKQ